MAAISPTRPTTAFDFTPDQHGRLRPRPLQVKTQTVFTLTTGSDAPYDVWISETLSVGKTRRSRPTLPCSSHQIRSGLSRPAFPPKDTPCSQQFRHRSINDTSARSTDRRSPDPNDDFPQTPRILDPHSPATNRNCAVAGEYCCCPSPANDFHHSSAGCPPRTSRRHDDPGSQPGWSQ